MTQSCCNSITERGSTAAKSTTHYARAALDVTELSDSFLITLDVPGAHQNDIEIAIENREMTVTAWPGRSHPEGSRVLRQEFGSLPWRRTINVGEDVDTEGTEATLANGVLQIRLPKSARTIARRVPIRTASDN